VLLGLVVEKPYRPVAAPELERRGLVLALAMGLLHLQHDLLAAGGHPGRDEDGRHAACERLAEDEAVARD
jgi:hypothetical protein